ncbi:YqxA family protein [Anoxybacteroides tepidamans]|uniref:YqxA family protein n=1 Tax=Anoxybacteroides tepidamans TaxID=265948 RepID=UPI000482F390|nr:YqxA family protein [Anoxybacillus tepidamans]
MVRFTIQFFAVVVLLFFGVLLGMQQANEGMVKMKGYHDPSFQTVLHLSKDEDGKLEAMVMGNKVTVENVDEKKKKLEQMKMFNMFSELGKRLAEAVRSSMRELLSFLS